MRKINLNLIFIISTALILAPVFSFAAINPNYGTTTFFSEKSEKPSDNPPIYDVGLRSGNKDGGKNKNKNSDDDRDEDDSRGGLFSQIVVGVSSLFSDNTNFSNNVSDESLFDWQKNSSSDSSEGANSEFIMGARGESYENLGADDIDEYNNRISEKFAFKDDGSKSAPKKSRLLFTNIVIPVDMTTQYIIIFLTVLVATGSVTGYYFWKKEIDRIGRKSKEE